MCIHVTCVMEGQGENSIYKIVLNIDLNMPPSCNKIVLCYITLVNSCLYILHSIYASPVQMNCTFGVCFCDAGWFRFLSRSTY